MFITCLYDLYGKPDAMRAYMELFRPLAESGLPFLLFTDPSSCVLWDIVYPNIRIIPLSLSDCELYQIGMSYHRFYDHSKNVLTDFCTMPIYKLTWETNVWSVIEYCAERDHMVWYAADHNDSMIMNAPVNESFNP